MLLSSNTHTLQLSLAGAVATTEVDWMVGYADKATGKLDPGSGRGVSNGTTAVTLVSAPAASHQRKITLLTVYNTDTASVTVSLFFDVSGTPAKLYSAVLAVDEQLIYMEGRGFVIYSSNGLEKTGTGGGGGDALTTDGLEQFAATTSLQLKGVISDETGSGALVFADSPSLVTPDLGVPSAGDLTNCTDLPPAGVVGGALIVADIGVAVQAYDAFLVSVAALGTAADKIIYTTAVNTAAEADITAIGRELLADASPAAVRQTVKFFGSVYAMAAKLTLI